MKPSPTSSAADRPSGSALHQPQSSAPAEAQEIAQHPRVTTNPPGGRHLPGLVTGCPQHSLIAQSSRPSRAPPPVMLATPPDSSGACESPRREALLNPASNLARPPPGQAAAPPDPQSARPSETRLPPCPPRPRAALSAARLQLWPHRRRVLAQAECGSRSGAKTGGRAFPSSGPCRAVTLRRETAARGAAARR